MITISNLTKRYRDVLAVDDVSLEIPNGSVCGLLGRNGAGKTTTFKCVLGFARPDAGDVRFDGERLAPRTFERLGYVPERPQLYPWMSVAEHVEMVRHSQPRFDAARAAELLATFRLPAKRASRKLSKGQQTALALTVALSTNPSLLVLDEPASGLDPVLQRAVLDILIDAAQDGATVLMSSHQIGQIDRAADRVAIMRDGKIVLAGETDDLRAAAKIVEGTFDGGVPELSGLSGVVRIERAGTTLRAYANGAPDPIVARFDALGARGVRVLDRSLEDLFLEAVSDEGAPS
ncbi:MAG TPA: ABC transporter ATP-binding protein [Candidatus Baltobacteraceae bacterium]|nr:ABC transporter ATP-binding protein [Candidatus Baltobacteraceae bacterium]